jgi:hypothetical protein
MTEKETKKNVYGENKPADEHGKEEGGIRERKTKDGDSTADSMDEAREDAIEQRPVEGGMGRKGTPKNGASQGEYRGVEEQEE